MLDGDGVIRWTNPSWSRAQRANASVLKTEGTGWDVGHAVKFLLSDYARYITGQVLVVDGGVTLQGPERDSRDH